MDIRVGIALLILFLVITCILPAVVDTLEEREQKEFDKKIAEISQGVYK